MKTIACFLSVCSLLSSDQARDDYLAFLKRIDKPNGSYALGEIEVVVSPSEIENIEEIHRNRLLNSGYSENDARNFSRVGIIAEDQYLIWIRDAVYFPRGIAGTYDRIIWKNHVIPSAPPGSAILPILPDGRIALNLNYRHATRSWELELARGASKGKETGEQTAIRKLKEETGLETASIAFLGTMTPDSGVLASTMPIYLVRASRQGMSDREYSEAIADAIALTKTEIERGFMDGFLEVPLNGKMEKVPFRDPFLAFALLQAGIRKLL